VKTALALFAVLVFTPFRPLYSQTSPDKPLLVHFVAPAYPRAARDRRMTGTTVSTITVAQDGSVYAVRITQAHPVFEKYVRDALRQWRFQPSPQGYTLEITVLFEFYDEECNMPGFSPETHVSADLPTSVTIRTELQCVITNTSSKR
jgi:TonB family protein